MMTMNQPPREESCEGKGPESPALFGVPSYINPDTGVEEWGSVAGFEEAPSTPSEETGESMFTTSEILAALAEEDAEVAGEVARLERNHPDLFTSPADEIEYITMVAEALGKKKLLEKMADRLSTRLSSDSPPDVEAE